MAFIQSHINNPMLQTELGGWEALATSICRKGIVKGYDEADTKSQNSSDFSSFDSYNKIHLHYERL